MRISKISAVAIGIVAIFLGYIFEKQNVAFMVGLAFAGGEHQSRARHVHVLQGHDDEGALVGGPRADQLGNDGRVEQAGVGGHARFPEGVRAVPYDNPAIFSIPLAFISIWLVSKMDRSRQAAQDRAGYDAQLVRSETGIGIAQAHAH